MLTFNLISRRTKNYFRGHEPSNRGNCWDGEQEFALVLTLEQARKLTKELRGPHIIIASSDKPATTDDNIDREIHCWRGGSWYDWPKSPAKTADEKEKCPKCGGPCDGESVDGKFCIPCELKSDEAETLRWLNEGWG